MAAAAYRAGEHLQDERLGESFDYSRRKGMGYKEILAPEHAPDWVKDRQRLWNEVELIEKRKDAQLCREINIALPRELDPEQQKELIRGFVQEQFVDRGMIADVVIHRNDTENPHAHVMLTMREITANGFGLKNREWNEKQQLEQWREEWANYANRALERVGFEERITHLSHAARGLETVPQIHEGYQARAMEERGIQTERGDINRMVKEHNAVVVELQKYRQQKEAEERWALFTPEEKLAVRQAANVTKQYLDVDRIQTRLEQLGRWEKKLDRESQELREEAKNYQNVKGYWESVDHHQSKADRIHPLKRLISKDARQAYQYHIRSIGQLQELLKPHQGTMGFQTREEFETKYAAFQQAQPERQNKIDDQRGKCFEERKLLRKAEKAFKNVEIRKVAEQYPDWKEAKYLSYDGAIALKQLNDREGRIVQPKEIYNAYDKGRKRIGELREQIKEIKQDGSRLNGAKQWLEKHDQVQSEVKRLDLPHNKIRRLLDKELQREYKDRLGDVDRAKEMMKHFGVDSWRDYHRQVGKHEQNLTKIPDLEKSITKMQPSLDFLSNLLQGMEKAGDAIRREAQRQREARKQFKGIERERER